MAAKALGFHVNKVRRLRRHHPAGRARRRFKRVGIGPVARLHPIVPLKEGFAAFVGVDQQAPAHLGAGAGGAGADGCGL